MKYLKKFNEDLEDKLFRNITKDEYFTKIFGKSEFKEGETRDTSNWDNFTENDIEEIDDSLIDSNCKILTPRHGKIELYRGRDLVVDIIKTNDYYFYIDHTPVLDKKGRSIIVRNFFECDTIEGVINCLNEIV